MKALSNVEKLYEYAQKIFQNAAGSHDWEHTLRVLALARRIAHSEAADMEIVEISAILHDIGRGAQDKSKGKICHAALGAEMAATILAEYGIPEDRIRQIVHCIASHRFRGDNPPETIEAKVLFDADKLDGIGAVGIGRAFLFSGEHHGMLHDPNPNLSPEAEYGRDDTAYREYVLKLSKTKDKMYTTEGKNIALARHEFMEAFFRRLNQEVQGEA